jgi:indolepyruvate ferredoxin oxidoreductase, beta subunit
MTSLSRPITVLIAALGGEGGGVLTDWIVTAASHCGFPVQSTSIPGVAQRTGATTYYLEMVPATLDQLGGRRPVLSLLPGIGDVDVLVASELMEAGRAIGNGFVTPDRTMVIASTGRSYLVVEKMAMGDGRFDSARLVKAIEGHAKEHVLIDMEALAKETGAIVNAVMLGAIAGSGKLPLPVAAFEAAIREDGKAVDSNLRGFQAGFDAVQRRAEAMPAPKGERTPVARYLEAIAHEVASWPAATRDVMIEGVRRLTRYQDLAYARLYLDRLLPIRAADKEAEADGKLLREVARHLAVRMSYEDVIKVAEAKIEPARMRRIAEELKAVPDEPIIVAEFLKPGIEEMCQVLPPWLARPILRLAERRGWLGRVYFGMEVKTTSITGYLRVYLLAKLKRWRRGTWRYRQEQTAIESWLQMIAEAAKQSPALAVEVAECARLIKGYGDTHQRGSGNFALIEQRIIRPALAGHMPVPMAIDAIASARAAALADPEGESLAKCLAEIERHAPLPLAAE